MTPPSPPPSSGPPVDGPDANSGSTQYFDPRPEVASAPVTVMVDLADVSFEMVTDRGVFSRGALDTGTRFLLERAPRNPQVLEGVELLDLGCGAGAIALTLARRHPHARIWAVDVNERARGLCEDNARRLGLDNVRVAAPADVPDTVRFREIWSNPPIRIGKAALHVLVARWWDRLEPSGRALAVVQRHLGADSLQTWLDAQGWPTRRVASSKGYRILVSHPRGIDDHPDT